MWRLALHTRCLRRHAAAGDLGVTVETRAGDTTSLLFAMRTMRDKLE